MKCKYVLCNPNFAEKKEGKKPYEYVILLG